MVKTGRRSVPLVLGFALVLGTTGLSTATAAPAAPAASARPVNVFPAPGTTTVSARTTITFAGPQAQSLRTVAVVGTASGRHSGRWVDAGNLESRSFVPDRPFAPGETVTVTSALAVAGGRGGTFTYRVAEPGTVLAGKRSSSYPLGSEAAAAATAAGPPAPAYRSRPDLHPPGISTRAASGRAPGLLLAAPQSDVPATQNGPLVYDDAGQPVWFHPVTKRLGNLTKISWFGRPALTWFEGETVYPGVFVGEWVVVDTSYREIARVRAGNGYRADVHDIQVTPAGRALLAIYNTVQRDLSAYGGSRTATVYDGVVQEVDLRTGAVTFEWHSLGPNGIPVSDSYIDLTTDVVDYFHLNSVAYDSDGNILISSRHTSAVVRIDRTTGAVIWRLGGKRSSFTFVNDGGPSFPHDARRRPDGTVSVFDNGVTRQPPYSRGAAWRLDPATGTATLAAQWRHSPELYSPIIGSNRQLSNGNQLVSFGVTGVATEYRGNDVVFESQLGSAQYTYRSYREDWHAQPVERPAVAVDRSFGLVTAYASWNGATEVVRWDLFAGPSTASLRVVGYAFRSGFETRLTGSVRSSDTVFAVRAADRYNRPLSTSGTLQVPYARADAVLAVRGAGSDLQTRNLLGSSFAPGVTYGGALTDDPAATVLSDGSLLLAAKGSPDGLYVKFSGTGGVSGWLSLGGQLTSRPSLSAQPGGSALVAVCGADRRVWLATIYRTGVRSGWVPLSGDCRGGGPAVTWVSDGSIVVSTTAGDRTVYARRGAGGAYAAWTSLGGTAVNDTAAAEVPGFPGTVMVAVRGVDARIWVQQLAKATGYRPSGWVDLGGAAAADASPQLLPAPRTGQLHVLVKAGNGAYYDKVRTGSSYAGWRPI